MGYPRIHSIKYILGETEGQYDDVAVFQGVLAENSFPNRPHLFGWGGYRKSSKTVFEMAHESMKKTLDVSQVAADKIGLVIICSSDFSPETEKEPFSKLLLSLGMTSAFPMGVTVSDCANLLSSLHVARQLIVGGQYKHIMLVTSNKITNEKYRFQDYALFSDGAASFIISERKELSAYPDGCFDVVDSQIDARFVSRSDDEDIDDSPLYIASSDEIVGRSKIAVSDLTKVFGNNLYLPVITIKEGTIGVTKTQLYLENVARFGHCFSADSVINLSDYMNTVDISEGEFFSLHSSAEGLRAQVLLRACSQG